MVWMNLSINRRKDSLLQNGLLEIDPINLLANVASFKV